MKKKFICKTVIDIAMTVLMLVLMARQITGNSAHEWLGTGMLILWITHHIMNRSWYRNLFNGKYTSMRIMQTTINIAIFLSMLGLMISGIAISREIFSFLPLSGGMALARSLHVLSAFWNFVLMGVHLGFHWNMLLSMARKTNRAISSKILRTIAVLIVGYGVYAFAKNKFLSYMFLTSSFVFFDFDRPVLFFFTEYIAIMFLFIFGAHCSIKGIKKITERKKLQ